MSDHRLSEARRRIYDLSRRGWPYQPLIRLALCLALLSGAAASGVSARSLPSTSIVTQTTLYVGQSARLTADIPSDWSPVFTEDADYAGPGGFVGSGPVAGAATLDVACAQQAATTLFGAHPTAERTTWQGGPACRITSADGKQRGLVIPHPFPFPTIGGEATFALLFADSAHFDSIVASMSFDSARVTPRAYLTSLLDIFQAISFWSEDVDWPRVRSEVLTMSEGSATLADTYPAIQQLWMDLRAVGDGHSFFITPSQMTAFVTSDPAAPLPTGQRMHNGLGYIALPGAVGNIDFQKQYSETAEQIIASIDESPTCGWIVDLRNNSGGAIGPMVIGVGALLDEGKVFGVQHADGNLIDVFYRDGHIVVGDVDQTPWVSQKPPPLSMSTPPVAVLVGLNTISAGEDTAMAFIRQAHVRSFGQLSYGLTTANLLVPLFDGAGFAIADGWVADRTGTIHPSGIEPDETVTGGSTDLSQTDLVLQAATTWLKNQPSCA